LIIIWILNGSLKGTISAPGSETAEEVNREIIEKVPEVAGKYKFSAIIMNTNEYYLPEFLTSSEISVCTVHILNIRSGAPITCFRNVNPP
jgi:hypothetical protein